ncbi:MAG TPA: DUF3443 family protein [Ramlibacter sp.]|jgi:hypothetical protein|uniref:DUF3443 family protein n=1 Tax=Ramlibacter sp. TaxID=1917967 RepID=UPI002D63C625|nr:DUF3443 family protein [Ramlibacter sp.]HZY19849.1 DUF3443 family protein [Ramlibacter sp.]
MLGATGPRAEPSWAATLGGRLLRAGRHAAAALAMVGIASCGGGGGGGGGTPGDAGLAPASASAGPGPVVLPAPAANVLAITVDRGVRGTAFNSPYVTVTVCTPGTTTCQEVDHVLVDTGSYGLRLAASAVASTPLPAVATDGGAPAAQCAQFASGFTWGSVRTADVQLGGQRIGGLPVQLIGDPAPPFAAPPLQCSNVGSDLATRLDAKGILGVGPRRQDCGLACASFPPPPIYFACSAGGCVPTALPVPSQVVNPVAALASDNNGVLLLMEPVAPGGAAAVAGALVLGIGTQANNQLGGAQVFAMDRNGLLSTRFADRTVPAFLDSGANGIYFPDTGLPRCGDFYCPPAPTPLATTIASANGASRGVDLLVEPLASLAPGSVAGGLAGPENDRFVWGLPFFFGRAVFVALEGAETPAGPGPFWAF